MSNLTGYKKFMIDKERDLLMEYVKDDLKRSPQIQMIFYLLIFMGFRVSEACSLKRRCVNGDKITFRLAKSHRLHTRIMPDSIKSMLFDYMQKYEHNFIDDYLFPPNISYRNNSNYLHIQPDTIAVYVSKFRKKHGLIDCYYTCKDGKKLYRISTHTIRHAFLTKFYELCGKDLLLVADVISHTKIGTTASYIRAWEKFKRERKVINKMAEVVNNGYTTTSSGITEPA